MELIKMAVAIKQISNYLDLDFKRKCISIFNKRWVQFDTDTYLVAFSFTQNIEVNLIILFVFILFDIFIYLNLFR
jgi:uncharacterized membrane protein SpoIIM required for sporulation